MNYRTVTRIIEVMIGLLLLMPTTVTAQAGADAAREQVPPPNDGRTER